MKKCTVSQTGPYASIILAFAQNDDGGFLLLALFTMTMFVSATLLFLVQPMFARMILPLLGGSPSVWNTAVVFYQTVLLIGYLTAHVMTTWLSVRRQIVLYGILLLLPLLVLPIGVPTGWVPPAEANPIPWLLALLSLAVGIPFFVVSTSSPMIQRWFSHTRHPSAHDPYFLYAASNVGSILGLLIYPFALERFLRVYEQSWLWFGGYGLYVVLMGACGILVWRTASNKTSQPATRLHARPETHEEPLSWKRRGQWVMWAIVPSSLMLSVTTYLSTNIASIPLFWVIPLTIYLVTFVLVFASKPIIPHWIMIRALPIILLPLIIVILVQATDPIWLLFPLHLIAFFIIAMACHGALANDRPPPHHLTEFYMWVSIGGAIGGVFNALLAPALFTRVIEYPLMLALVAFFALRPSHNQTSPSPAQQQVSQHWWHSRKLDIVAPLVLAAVIATLVVGVQMSNVQPQPLRLALIFGLPVLMCFSFSRRPVRFGLGVTAIVLVGMTLYNPTRGDVVHLERSFFGVHKVLRDDERGYMMLVHGTTLHGVQSLDPERAGESLSYYHPTGPIGQVLETLQGREGFDQIAVVGLGVGSLACYRQDGQEWTYYEIDPLVEKIARDPRFFTYLETCAPDMNIVLGDARLSLAQAAHQQYDLIVLDAYSSDAIPLHLITREAFDLYLDKLSPDGILAFHISNRYLDLKPVLAALSHDLGLVCLFQNDMSISEEEASQGKNASQWVVIARSAAHLDPLTTDSRWNRLESQPQQAVWTDDFASIFDVLEW